MTGSLLVCTHVLGTTAYRPKMYGQKGRNKDTVVQQELYRLQNVITSSLTLLQFTVVLAAPRKCSDSPSVRLLAPFQVPIHYS